MTTQSAALSTTTTLSNPPRGRSLAQRQRMWGLVFLSPWIAGFLLFTLFPMAASLYYSFTDFTIGKDIHWVGLANWQHLFVDPDVLTSLGVTLRFGAYLLPISIIFPLILATLLNSKVLKARPVFRALFYMPYVIPAISGIFIWQSFLNGATGWLNRILHLIGIANPPNWLSDPNWVSPALVLISLWGVGNAMLTMMAGMQGIATELYEAAHVDGAGPLTTWRKITLPLISPVIFYNIILTVIGLMQYFIIPYVLTQNTRADSSTYFINLFLYRTAFQFFEMGYASTLAWFLFIVALAITLFIFATARRWVYYASGD